METRPLVWIGHARLTVSDLGRSADFWHTVGIREVERNEHIVVLELRGGTHLVLLPGAPSAGADAPFDLMVDDLEATHDEWERIGLDVSPIERGRIHSAFVLCDPDGTAVTVNSSHVVGDVYSGSAVPEANQPAQNALIGTQGARADVGCRVDGNLSREAEKDALDFGAHLPLMDFGDHPYTLEHLVAYTKAAAGLGFAALAVNDHMVFSVPWLDGPVALAAVMEHSREMTLATTVALAVVRGPVPVAKTLGAIDRLSGGRLLVAVGPGSSREDYAAVGLDFSERWQRFDEAIGALRALWRRDGAPFVGRFYSTDGLSLEPLPAQPFGPPIWVGSWGSDTGLRRVARLADGWLASAYNTTPDLFGQAWQALRSMLEDQGKPSDTFPNALATMWCYITDDPIEADRILRERVIPTVHRPEDMLRERLPIGPPEVFAEKLTAFAKAGVQRVFIWPVADELHQLERFWNDVRPLVAAT